MCAKTLYAIHFVNIQWGLNWHWLTKNYSDQGKQVEDISLLFFSLFDASVGDLLLASGDYQYLDFRSRIKELYEWVCGGGIGGGVIRNVWKIWKFYMSACGDINQFVQDSWHYFIVNQNNPLVENVICKMSLVCQYHHSMC